MSGIPSSPIPINQIVTLPYLSWIWIEHGARPLFDGFSYVNNSKKVCYLGSQTLASTITKSLRIRAMGNIIGFLQQHEVMDESGKAM